MKAGSLEHESALMYGSMLGLELYIGKPWLDASGIAYNVLLVNGVFVALQQMVSLLEAMTDSPRWKMEGSVM